MGAYPKVSSSDMLGEQSHHSNWAVTEVESIGRRLKNNFLMVLLGETVLILLVLYLCEHKNALQRLLALITWFTKLNCVNINLHRDDFLRSEFACLKKIM